MTRGTPRSDSLRGALDLIVLRVLDGGPLHGYAVARRIRELTDDALRVEEGSLYPALYRMERRGWVEARWQTNETNRRVRVYSVTASGRRQLGREMASWTSFAEGMARLIDAT